MSAGGRVLRIPASWMPACRPKRIIFHWTAGEYEATAHDRACYHVLIEGDGNHVRGVSIADNCPRNARYAAHCLNANNYAIGVAACCMKDARQAPPKAGPFPLTRGQWNAMVWAAADLCRRYDLPVTPSTVLGHGEVQRVLGIRQKGKWDPMWLPFAPDMSPKDVGDWFRRRVAAVV